MTNAAPNSVLIIKPSSLGDVVSATPVLRGLRRSFPEAHIAWLVTPSCADVLAGEDALEVIEFDRRRFGRIGRSLGATRDFWRFCRALRRRRFDWVIDLQGLFRSGFLARVTGAPMRAGFANAREFAGIFYTRTVKVESSHTIDRNIELARELGIDARAEDLSLAPSERARQAAAALLAESGAAAGQYILIAPATRWPTKLYPLRHWRRVINTLSRGRKVLLVGSPDEQALCAELAEQSDYEVANLAGRTSPGELAAVIASAGAVICSDSASKFIAAATDTPSVTLIGPTQPERTGPYGPLGRGVIARTACQGCLKRRCDHITCMQTIEPDEVIAAVNDALANADAIGADAPNQ